MRFLLHAPNVHSGGGLVLLHELLSVRDSPLAWAQLDFRVRQRLTLQPGVVVQFIVRSIAARLAAEWRLWRESHASDVVLCFHGMPPLFPVRGRVIVFQQNRILLGNVPLGQYPFKVALRIAVERLICICFRRHVDEYVVQTPSMARALRQWHSGNPQVRVLPFMNFGHESETEGGVTDHYDFVYVASGDAHKNHRSLLDAWVLLSHQGVFPSLALTIDEDSKILLESLKNLRSRHQIRVDNLGALPREQVLGLYRRTRALIFPSTAESFGIPLLEAAAHGLPIVASELDYVRDVVTPTETFDPNSSVSIARAVRRFLESPEAPVSVVTSGEFLLQLLQP